MEAIEAKKALQESLVSIPGIHSVKLRLTDSGWVLVVAVDVTHRSASWKIPNDVLGVKVQIQFVTPVGTDL